MRLPFSDANLILVFFVYGLALFTVGLTTALEARRSRAPSVLGANLWPLAAFAFLHGTAEWVQMFSIMQRHGVAIPGQGLLPVVEAILMFAAFALLLYFGTSFLAEDLQQPNLLWLMPVFVAAWVLVSTVLTQLPRAPEDWTQHANICGRYLLYFPGALLAALALIRQGRFYRAAKIDGVGISCQRAGMAFIASAALSGLVVPSADFFPASVLNYPNFASATGLPIAVVRALVALVIAYFLISAVRRLDSERRRQLEFANSQLERLALQVLNAQEAERKRIARELHDETVQLLSILLMRIKLLRGVEGAEARSQRLDDLSKLTLQAAQGLRRIARDLRPPAIDDLGLVPALEWYVEHFREEHGLEVEVRADRTLDRPSPEVELTLYRVAQEALTNVAKHAQARTVRVDVKRTASLLVAQIEDDGRGFNVAAVRASKVTGLGLFGMEERAALVGAELKIHSRPGRGTRVQVRVPVVIAYA